MKHIKIKEVVLKSSISLCIVGIGLCGCKSSSQKILRPRAFVPSPVAGDPSPQQTIQPRVNLQHINPIHTHNITPPVMNISTPQPPIVDVPALPAKSEEYIVKKGDSYWKIARAYGISSIELKAFNNKTSNKLKVKEVLLIPPGAKFVPKDQRPNNPVLKSNDINPGTNNGTYKVQSGDYVGKIAQKYGLKTSDILEANNLTPKSMIQVGQILIIPGNPNATVSVNVEKTPEQTQPSASTDADLTGFLDDSNTETTPEPTVNTPPTNSELDDLEDILNDSGSSSVDLDSILNNTNDYTVKKNETLRIIANKHLITSEDLKKANPDITNGENDILDEDITIKIP